MAVSPIPEGYHNVIPYLVVGDVAATIEFLRPVFGAVVIEEPTKTPDGRVMHAEVRIGDSVVMMGEPTDEFRPMPTCLYVYSDDVDATYRRALQAGATSVREPADQFYGDRSAGVKDAFGNLWWIATHIKDVSPEELAKEMEAMSR